MASPLAEAHTEAQAQLRQAVCDAIIAIWNGLPNHSDEGVELFNGAALPILAAGQRQAIALTDSYFASEMYRPPYGLDADAIIADIRGDTTPEEVYRRSFVTLWTGFKRKSGLYEELNRAATADLIGRVKIDLQLAATHAARAVTSRDPNIFGLWRVLHGTCELCADAVATATPATGLMPIHPGCQCAFEPITSQRTARQTVTRGPKTNQTLDVTRIEQHGEYGDTLVDRKLLGKDLTKSIDPTYSGSGPIKAAIQDCNAVHRVPKEFGAVDARLETGRTLARGAGGYYVPTHRWLRLTKRGKAKGPDGAESIIQHEIGHSIDNGFFRMAEKELAALMREERLLKFEKGGGAQYYLSELLDHPTGDLADALGEDLATVLADMQEIKRLIYQSDAWDKLFTATSRGGALARNGDYYKSGRELFARAYNQYIAYKRGDQGVINYVGQDHFAQLGVQWRRDDFQPIMKAFDRLFRHAGLLKETPEAKLKGGAIEKTVEAITDEIANLRLGGAKWNEVRRQLGVTWTDTKMRNMLRKQGYNPSGRRE